MERDYGIAQRDVIEALRQGKRSGLTATYWLLRERELRKGWIQRYAAHPPRPPPPRLPTRHQRHRPVPWHIKAAAAARLPFIGAAPPMPGCEGLRLRCPELKNLPSSGCGTFAGTFQATAILLEEDIDQTYEPTEAEIDEYAQWLGMVSPDDDDLRWIPREGLKAPLPEHWKACKTSDGEVYYFNFSTGDSVWDHPCDEYYRKLFDEEKRKN